MRKSLESYALKALEINENSETRYISRSKNPDRSKIKGFCGYLPVKWRSTATPPPLWVQIIPVFGKGVEVNHILSIAGD